MTDAVVTIYESTFCPYCTWAKRLLDTESINYSIINVDRDPSLRSEMETRSGRTSVPQIFFGEHHVGGYDNLSDVQRNGQLDALLSQHIAPANTN